jgi:hypothetical protein
VENPEVFTADHITWATLQQRIAEANIHHAQNDCDILIWMSPLRWECINEKCPQRSWHGRVDVPKEWLEFSQSDQSTQ